MMTVGGVESPLAHTDRHANWIQDQIPTVPSHKTAHAHPDPRQTGNQDNECPSTEEPESAADHPLHDVKRHKSQQRSRPGTEENQNQIDPEVCPRARAEVDEVGKDVG